MKTKNALCGLQLGLLLLAAGSTATHAQLLVGGYTATTYASGLPVDSGVIAGMSMDPASRQIYYMGENTGSFLHRLDPGGAVTTLTFDNTGGFYPYVSTDIEYYNGSVYMSDASGNLIKFSATTPTSSLFATIPGFGIESGLARVGNTLYVTGGNTTTGIRAVNLTTAAVSTPAFALPINASSLEYDSVHNRLIVAQYGSGGFNTINLATGAPGTPFGAGPTSYGNFSVDPTGTTVFSRLNGTLYEINIASGAVSLFYSGLESSGFADSVFGPSSSGPGESLYIGNGSSIIEVSGFPAVPEPSTLALIGLSGLLLVRFRRRQAA